MKSRFVVVAYFARLDTIPASRVGAPNPWAQAQADDLAGPFNRLGLKSPFTHKELDPLFLIEWNNLPVGYARVFEKLNWAEQWFQSLIKKEDVWAYWQIGGPVGPLGTPEQYRTADQFVKRMMLYSLRAFTVRGAAETAWSRFQSSGVAIASYRADYGSQIRQVP